MFVEVAGEKLVGGLGGNCWGQFLYFIHLENQRKHLP